MKSSHLLISSILNFLLLLSSPLHAQTLYLNGAWESGTEENRVVMIVAGRYFSAAQYNKANNTWLGTYGGTWRIESDSFFETDEFNTQHPEWIGTELKSQVALKEGKLILKSDHKTEIFSRIDDGKPGQLSGAWVITGRMTGTGMQKITPGARMTMKILSGTRFQWIAYNSETKEFFGTGGGKYTTENGKYTENIEFFSRDNSRVGMKLQFDFAQEAGDWHHKGLSSKGDPIDELWTLREKLEK